MKVLSGAAQYILIIFLFFFFFGRWYLSVSVFAKSKRGHCFNLLVCFRVPIISLFGWSFPCLLYHFTASTSANFRLMSSGGMLVAISHAATRVSNHIVIDYRPICSPWVTSAVSQWPLHFPKDFSGTHSRLNRTSRVQLIFLFDPVEKLTMTTWSAAEHAGQLRYCSFLRFRTMHSI